MKRLVVFGSLLALAGCGEMPTSSEGIETTTGELAVSKFSTWTRIPGGGGFGRTPAIFSAYSDANTGTESVSAVTTNQLLSTFRVVLNGTSSAWATWTEQTPPAGVTFGSSASAPALTQYTNNFGSFGALAARERTGSCPNCIWLRIGQHAQPVTWFQVPNTGTADGFGATDFSLVASNGFLYIVASKFVGSSYRAFFKRNDVSQQYSNAGWSAWVQDPAGGLFQNPVIASAFPPSGNLVVSGRGLSPGGAWVSRIFVSNGTWEGGWATPGFGTFNDSPSATTFSLTGGDVAFMGLGTNNAAWEGSWNSSRTAFDGWFQIGPTATFMKSPASFAPLNNLITAATLTNIIDDTAIFVSRYKGP